jgi:hypothetical protein
METVLKLWLHADNNAVSFPLFCASQLSWLKGIQTNVTLCPQCLFHESPCLSWTRGCCHRGKLCVLCQSQHTMQDLTKNLFQGTLTTLGFWFYQPEGYLRTWHNYEHLWWTLLTLLSAPLKLFAVSPMKLNGSQAFLVIQVNGDW